jgi:hypothetical protein
MIFIVVIVNGHSESTLNDSVELKNGFMILAGHDKTYKFTDVNTVSQGAKLLVTGRVKSAGKQLRGHIDIAITDSAGKTIREVSVKPYANNRAGIGSLYTIGFPFKTSVSLGNEYQAKDLRVKLVLHRDTDKNDIVFDCGSNLTRR